MQDYRNGFKVGDYVIYQNSNEYQIGKIKRLSNDSAFVYYSEGDTAAKTPFEYLHKLSNAYVIDSTYLGGDK